VSVLRGEGGKLGAMEKREKGRNLCHGGEKQCKRISTGNVRSGLSILLRGGGG